MPLGLSRNRFGGTGLDPLGPGTAVPANAPTPGKFDTFIPSTDQLPLQSGGLQGTDPTQGLGGQQQGGGGQRTLADDELEFIHLEGYVSGQEGKPFDQFVNEFGLDSVADEDFQMIEECWLSGANGEPYTGAGTPEFDQKMAQQRLSTGGP